MYVYIRGYCTQAQEAKCLDRHGFEVSKLVYCMFTLYLMRRIGLACTEP